MIKTIIYSCVFFNEKYIHLINLLLKSYKLFGNSSNDVDYLIICKIILELIIFQFSYIIIYIFIFY